jgi:serine protease inhibitor
MNKNIQNPILKSITKYISLTSILFSLVVLLSCGYIVCVYKTVTVASNHEKTLALFTELQSQVGTKEHVYIEKTSSISMGEALAMGYEKTTGSVAYIKTHTDTSLAIR